MKRPTKAEQKRTDELMKRLLKSLLQEDSRMYLHIANCNTCLDAYQKIHKHTMAKMVKQK